LRAGEATPVGEMGENEESTCPVKAKLDKEEGMRKDLEGSGGAFDFSGDPLRKQLEFALGKIDEAYARGKMNENTLDDFKAELISIKNSKEGDDGRRLRIGRLIGSVINQ